MPLLSADAPLTVAPRRVLVAGTSGAGKTTLARALSERWSIPHTEIDGLFHGADWEPRPSFVADVTALVAQDAWVIEWQYTAVRPLLAERAELLVWLDLPHHLVLWRVVRRTVRRRLRRTPLWNGNTEGPLRTFFTDPDHIVRWAWRTRHETGQRVAALLATQPALVVVRLRSRGEVARWLARA